MKRLLLSLGLGILMACQNGGGAVQIDYVDFVQFGGITYVAAWTSPGRPLQEGELGAAYARVKVKLEGSQDPGHRLQDGDAAFLDPGTPVFQVKGYRPRFRQAAHEGGRLTLYEADTNTKAKIGADLVDLVEKVVYIGINSSQDGHTELAAIRDPAQVAALVNMVLTSPVSQIVPIMVARSTSSTSTFGTGLRQRGPTGRSQVSSRAG